MVQVKDLHWKKDMRVSELVNSYENVGFQSVELYRASEVIVKMKKDSAQVFLTFTSNMVTSGLRGFFAQLIELGIADVLVTTVGGLEEDIMKATGEVFSIGNFNTDDVELHERGINRVGNLLIQNQSYMNFEDMITDILRKLYAKQNRWSVSEMLREIGLLLDDQNSILYQAAKNNVPVFCPAITDGAFGFHLFLFQQENPDFIVDVVKDFGNILLTTSYDDRKGVIALGGSISKHHAILATLLNGGAEYAVYMTTAHRTSGSMSGANTSEAKSWGKVKDESDIATVIGDVSITFPMAMTRALDELYEEGLLNIENK
ncbi:MULTISPECIES: deoxyhypusine synthase family protein [Methanohalophilus]|uniref:Probable deoxyhypusine synthase n=1 Tax=Methanohalophilus euhalobius TaxID=51203 RepID=A0A285G9F4_9EURY|nr:MULTISPECIES: deoxyhypusine synthase family protein [Methanohalophilus]ODV50390.1 MAG: deoxyhypusine synthase [Methanohalophilus sp. 2-GBenrich]PQV42165.1 deoxyhypusine synthase [Methanohalophilus euhalobius]RNI07201.1 deoxyhypusine synthase [Methanohalophilus euhalobius]TCL11790.1 deoxyhypusine synthase [Methanohalophilus euhalobius]SNY20095.1 deoxyhypusine synthase [Methanohalophilus euhalobius]